MKDSGFLLCLKFLAARRAFQCALVILVIGISFVCLTAARAQDTAWFIGGSRDGYDSDLGDGAPDVPWVNNALGATNVTATSAWLNGVLAYTGSAPATVHVYWGETDGGTNKAAWSHTNDFGIVDEFDLLTVEIAVTGGSVYYYRFYATNTAEEAGWAPESAVFQACSAPAVSTGHGAGAGITTAVLYGELTGGIEAEMWVDWGATTEGVEPGSPVTIDMGTRTEAGSVDAPNPFYQTISGLTASSTYAYRVRATNEWGAATSAWVWFATHPTNFIVTSDLGWPQGGYYDGYDYLGMDGPMPGWRHGTSFKLR